MPEVDEIIENWITAMIEREAIPKAAREETVDEFCLKWGIPASTYYYQSSKPDNWKKTLEISLNKAKKDCPEILQVLGEKAKAGDMKAIDMYLNYIVQLAKNLDIKSDGKQIIPLAGFNYVKPTSEDTDNKTITETAQSLGEITGQSN